MSTTLSSVISDFPQPHSRELFSLVIYHTCTFIINCTHRQLRSLILAMTFSVTQPYQACQKHSPFVSAHLLEIMRAYLILTLTHLCQNHITSHHSSSILPQQNHVTSHHSSSILTQHTWCPSHVTPTDCVSRTRTGGGE